MNKRNAQELGFSKFTKNITWYHYKKIPEVKNFSHLLPLSLVILKKRIYFLKNRYSRVLGEN